MDRPQTLFDKIWRSHLIDSHEDGASLLYIDRHLIHEVSSPQAFEGLRLAGRRVRRPEAALAVADHNVPTTDRSARIDDEEARIQIETLEANCRSFGIELFGMDDRRQGIVHIIGPEQGLTQPGITLVCGDSHTSTHGALGAFAMGIGASDVEHVMATQTLVLNRPANMRIMVDGALGFGVGAKDLILAIIGAIGMAGGTGHVIEYAGATIRALGMEARMTVCNMSIEAGARAGLIAPDDVTFAYLEGRAFAPHGAQWDGALASWRTLPADEGAVYDREVAVDASAIAPLVTWGTSPQDSLPITARVPAPADFPAAERRQAVERALAYMDLAPGTPLQEVAVDRVFIGSCTNGRLEDIRAVAAVVKGRRVAPHVSAMVVPGSGSVKRAAEAEGLDQILTDAGFEWREPGCSMCVGMNADQLAAGERCASTSNRNFEGRQGRGGRTHLMSPMMAAAAAVTGRLTDIRTLAQRVPLAPDDRQGDTPA